MNLIDSNGISLYYQLKEHLKKKINEKFWLPGDKIPNEIELSLQYGISRSTVRQAILELVKDGLLFRKKGIGTFVAKPKYQTPISLEFSYPEQFGTKHTLISKKIIKPDSNIIKTLNVTANQDIYELTRLRYFNDEPAAIEILYAPVNKFPGLFDLPLHGRIFDLLLEHYKTSISDFDVLIEPLLLTGTQKQILELSNKPNAGLKITRVCYDNNGINFLMHNSIFRGDCCSVLFKAK